MMSITHFLKGLFRGPAARTAAVLSQECACSLQNKAGGSLYLSAHSIPRSAFMSPRSALMSHTTAGKNGKNVFIIAKILSSVLLASALINLRSALLSLRSALLSLISAGKNGKNVFIGVKSSVANWQARL